MAAATHHRELLLAFAVVAALAVVGVAVTDGGARIGVTNTAGFSGFLFTVHADCELPRIGRLAQPANALSALAFLVGGFGILARIGPRRPGEPVPPALFATATMVIALGSFSFHRSATEWSGWLDATAVHAFLLLWIASGAGRMAGGWDRRIARGYAVAVAVAGAAVWLLPNVVANTLMVSLIAVALGGEAVMLRRGLAGDRRLLVATLSAFGLGLVVFALSRTGGPWCDPAATLQGHAAWHVMAAAGVALLYAYLYGERQPARAS